MDNESIKRIKSSMDYKPCFKDMSGHFQAKDCTIPKEYCCKLPTCRTCDIYLMKEEYKKKQQAPIPLEIQFAILKAKGRRD